MQALLFAELTRKTLSETLTGGAFSFPKLIQGDTATIGLRWCQRQIGSAVPVERTLRTLRASIGFRDRRPTAGTYRIQIGNPSSSQVEGTNLTTALAFSADASAVQTALDALSAKPGDCVVTENNGTFLVEFTDAEEATTLTARHNHLSPVSVINYEPYESDGQWINSFRLTQVPLAFVDAFEEVLPPPPVITRVTAGSDDLTGTVNEEQQLYRPPEFRGKYILKFGGKKSPSLTETATIDDVKKALAGIAPSGGSFAVAELAGQNAVSIVFGGTMAGVAQDLIEVEVISHPPGDPTFSLDLGKAEMAAALRDESNIKNGEMKVPLEIEARFHNGVDDDETDTVTWSVDVSIIPQVTLPEAALPSNLDWLRKPSPVDYALMGDGQISTGVKAVHFAKGNGVATVFTCDHDLASDHVFVSVRENTTHGKILRPGTDYDAAEGDTNNTMIVTMRGDYATSPPTTAAIIVTCFGLDLASAYASHTHAQSEVVDLTDDLDAIRSRLSTLEALIPIGSLLADTTQKTTAKITLAKIPPMLEAFPSRVALASSGGKTSLAALDLAKLPKDGGLLPAVLDAAVENLPSPLPAAADTYRGRVFVNFGSSSVVLPGGGGRKSRALAVGDFAACNGKYWYAVNRIASTEPNFYPSDFDREIALLAITEDDLSLKRTLSLSLGFECAILSSRGASGAEFERTRERNTSAQWELRIEHGAFSYEAAAAGVVFTAPASSYLLAPDLENVPDGTPVKLSTTGTLPAPLSPGVVYYTRDTSDDNRRVAATLGGSYITLTDTGTGTHTIIPQTASKNLKSVTWNATPILARRFQITRTPQAHQFGCAITRSLVSSVDTITAQQIAMGNSSAAGSAPASANFALRVRLARFDVEDDIADPRALVVINGFGLKVITSDADAGSVTLKSA